MSKAWGGMGIGAWADEAERADEEAEAKDTQSFPSLKEAVSDSTKSSKRKKNTMSLSEFTKAASYTRDETVRLPTAPRQRSEEEMQMGGPRGFRVSDSGGRRSYDEQRSPPQVSRADEADDWGKGKKSLPLFDQPRQTRAEVDNWGAGKSSLAKPSTFGSGVREERRRLVLEPRKVAESCSAVKASKGSPFGAARPREEVLAEKGLDWKKIDSEIEAKKGGSSSRPSSAHSSRPSSAQSSRSESLGLGNVEAVLKPRVKVNPFGDAKPREVLLEEQGKDWRKIDSQLEHRRVDRSLFIYVDLFQFYVVPVV